MKKPTLFIVGAPKCGTTSMAYWLSQHPLVYVSKPKEPNYFSFDLKKFEQRTESQYRDLFKKSRNAQVIVDASTRYLVSEVAVDAALSYSPNAKFIAMIRNPIEMFFSLHNHLYQTGIESEKLPRKAWRQQWERQANRRFQDNHPEPVALQYSRMCSLGTQIDRFFRVVPPAQRKVLILDDLERDPYTVMHEIMDFLGLPLIDLDLTPRNARFRARSRMLQTAIRRLSTIKRHIGWRGGLGILNALSRANRTPHVSTNYSDSFRKCLEEHFVDEIHRLSRLLDRDFSRWSNVADKEV